MVIVNGIVIKFPYNKLLVTFSLLNLAQNAKFFFLKNDWDSNKSIKKSFYSYVVFLT